MAKSVAIVTGASQGIGRATAARQSTVIRRHTTNPLFS